MTNPKTTFAATSSKANGTGSATRQPTTWKPSQTVLVLQGGGALGAYQAGVYQALHEAGIEPDWIIGTSIGRARQRGETDGFMKVTVDAATERILGAAVLGIGGDEVVQAFLGVMAAGARSRSFRAACTSTRRWPNTCRRCSGI